MDKKCPNCEYERQPKETTPDYECPKCGIIYHKYRPASDKFKNEVLENQKPMSQSYNSISYKKFINLKTFVLVTLVIVVAAYSFNIFFGEPNENQIEKKDSIYNASKFKYDIRGMYKGAGYYQETGHNWDVELSIGEDYRITNIKWTYFKSDYKNKTISWAYPSDIRLQSSEPPEGFENTEKTVLLEGQNLIISMDTPHRGIERFEILYNYKEIFINNDMKRAGIFHRLNNTDCISCVILAMIPPINQSDSIPKEDVDIQFSKHGAREFVKSTDTRLYGIEEGMARGVVSNINSDVAFKLKNICVKKVGQTIGLPQPFTHMRFLLDINFVTAKRESFDAKGTILLEEQEETFYRIAMLDEAKFKIQVVFCEDGENYALHLNRKIDKHIDPVTRRETFKYFRYELEKSD